MRYLAVIAIMFAAACAQNKTSNTYQGLGSESVSPEVLAQYAPKNPNLQIMNKVQQGLDIRSPGLGTITEDGKTLFFGWNVTGSAQVWKINSPLGFPTQLTGGEDATSITNITAQGKLLLSRDVGGEENPGIYIMDKNGGEMKELFKKKKVQARASYVSLNGDFFYFTANDKDPSIYTHYIYNLKTNQITEFFNEKGLWMISDVWNDEKTLIMTKLLGNTAFEHYLYNIDEKKLTPIIGVGENADYEAAFGNSTKDFIIRTNKLGNYGRLYHLRDGKLTPISPDIKYDVETFSIDQNHSRILYEVNVDGYTKLYGLSMPSFKPLALPSFPKEAEHVFAGRTTRNSRYTSFGVSFHNEPRQSFIYDWNKKVLTRWTQASTPEIDTKNFVKAKIEHYPARDGTKIPYVVRIPKSCEKVSCPVIVHFHGGPEGQSMPGFSPYWENFIREGFIVAEPNVRGSTGYGKEWLESDNAAKRLNVITDIEDAGIYLKKKYSASKIGVMGGSYGGYSTLYAMTKFAGTYDAGVANVGMSNLVTFLMNTAPYRRPLRISEYGDPEKDLEALKELSPITHIEKLKSPLLIVQGVNDPRVPVGEAIQFKKYADQKKIPVELMLFADEGHGSSKRNNQAMDMTKTVEFFIKYLK